MNKKMLLLPLMFVALLGSLIVPVYADGTVQITVEGRIYGYHWQYVDYGGGVDGLEVTAFTDDLACDKVSFRYWLGSQQGSPDLENKNVPTSLVGGNKVAVDVQAEPEFCEEWYIQVHFHSTSNTAGSVKVGEGVHVPWFTSLPLALLGAIGGVALLKVKLKVKLSKK